MTAPRTAGAGGGTSAQAAAAAAVASLPAMTPQRLRKLASAAWASPMSGQAAGGDACGEPADWTAFWDRLQRGGAPAVALAITALGAPAGAGEAARLAGRWTAASRRIDAVAVATRYSEAGVEIDLPHDAAYPMPLAGDPEAPAVLFRRGRPVGSGACSVSIVGTRSATHYGMDVAAELGAGLAGEGVTVVSGLAVGIDAAAHEGAVARVPPDAPHGTPVAVAGSGLDIFYPVATRRLRERIEACGTVFSEAPLGAAPEPWRFPLRNRIIAGLSTVLVVVESHRGGGSLHTVEAAISRGVEVMAVPGSIRSPASEGTNALIAAGAQVVTTVADVLEALERRGVAVPGSQRHSPAPAGSRGRTKGPERGSLEASVLAAVDDTPTPTQVLLERVDADLGAVALALEYLAEAGLVNDCGGAWVRRGARRAN